MLDALTQVPQTLSALLSRCRRLRELTEKRIPITLTNSTVSNNTASDGGGIYNNGGTVTLKNSKVTNNIPNDCVGC